MIKLLIGGSPCTKWSIAQKNNRETEPSGIGWELFRNYVIAKEKFKPDFFLYENNKSAAQPIKDEISKELGADLMYINSALVSAQNRQRFYAFNWKVDQPHDRGILLADILESGVCCQSKSYCLTATEQKGSTLEHNLSKHVRTLVYVPINTTSDGKSQTLKAQYSFTSVQNICCYDSTYGATGVAVKTDEHPTPFTGPGKDKESIKRIYEVKNSEIEIKGRVFPIRLPDGFYHIRKLTVTECCRLQTLPDDYCRAVSPTQAYKGIGNGWTAEVIIHILNGALKDVPRDEEILCLSMYDGIGTGRYCLDKMGFKNVKYFAYEIDKYAMTVANSNFSDIIQCGDAFNVRKDDWKIGG